VSLSNEERSLWRTLKSALLGGGLSLRSLFGGFGPDTHFYGAEDYPPVTVANEWVTVDEFVLDLEGGNYWLDVLTFFTGAETNVDYQVRFLTNGTPTGEVISKELKDVDDQMEYTTFNQRTFPPGPLTVTVQCQIVGAGTPSMTLTRLRARMFQPRAT
jgi:hypothetical protein